MVPLLKVMMILFAAIAGSLGVSIFLYDLHPLWWGWVIASYVASLLLGFAVEGLASK